MPRSKFKILQSASPSTSRTGLDRQGTQCQEEVSKERHGVHASNNIWRWSRIDRSLANYYLRAVFFSNANKINGKLNGWTLDFAMAATFKNA